MHKAIKTGLAPMVGLALALGAPLAASATTTTGAQPVNAHSTVASQISLTQSKNQGQNNQGQNNQGNNNQGQNNQGQNNNNGNNNNQNDKDHSSKPSYPPSTPPSPPASHCQVVEHGDSWSVDFSYPAGTFKPGSTVYVAITGLGKSSFYGTFRAGDLGKFALGTAAADGSLTAQLKAKAGVDLAGQTLNATVTDSAGTSVAQAVAVPAAVRNGTASQASPAAAAKPTVSTTIASPSTDVSLATVGGAAALVALGIAFLSARVIGRRKARARA